MVTDEGDIARIAAEIERYLTSRPNAADSAEGIATWWLARQRYEESVAKVQVALERLVRQGFVTKRTQRDGQVTYAAMPMRARQ